jgi:putative endopeptidase
MSNSLKAMVICALVLTLGVTITFGQTAHFDVAGMDTKTAACTDFYQYANGGWLAANPIPAAFSAWGVANVLNEKNRDALHEILEAASKNAAARKGSNEQKIGDYYASCMDEAKIEADGLKPIQAEFDLIAKVSDQKSLQAEIAHLHTFDYNAAFGSGSNRDFKNSADVIIGIQQGGLGLPTRDYYFKDDAGSKMIRDEYLKHVARMFELMGDDSAKAASEAQAVMNLESKLAQSSKAPVDLREPEKLYHRMPATAVKDLSPTFDWAMYFQTVAHSKADVNVATPDFFPALDTQLTATPIADWQSYLRWNVINRAAAGLSSKFVDEDFHFKGTVMQGAKENLPRWKRCVAGTDGALGEALARFMCRRRLRPPPKRARWRWSATLRRRSRVTSPS